MMFVFSAKTLEYLVGEPGKLVGSQQQAWGEL